jgi:hypothetical protein
MASANRIVSPSAVSAFWLVFHAGKASYIAGENETVL